MKTDALDSKMFKITKCKAPGRLNFVLDGRHYSMNEFGDTYESTVGLQCKETKKMFKIKHAYSISDCIGCYINNDFFYKHGSTYKQRFKMHELEKCLRDMIYQN